MQVLKVHNSSPQTALHSINPKELNAEQAVCIILVLECSFRTNSCRALRDLGLLPLIKP